MIGLLQPKKLKYAPGAPSAPDASAARSLVAAPQTYASPYQQVQTKQSAGGVLDTGGQAGDSTLMAGQAQINYQRQQGVDQSTLGSSRAAEDYATSLARLNQTGARGYEDYSRNQGLLTTGYTRGTEDRLTGLTRATEDYGTQRTEVGRQGGYASDDAARSLAQLTDQEKYATRDKIEANNKGGMLQTGRGQELLTRLASDYGTQRDTVNRDLTRGNESRALQLAGIDTSEQRYGEDNTLAGTRATEDYQETGNYYDTLEGRRQQDLSGSYDDLKRAADRGSQDAQKSLDDLYAQYGTGGQDLGLSGLQAYGEFTDRKQQSDALIKASTPTPAAAAAPPAAASTLQSQEAARAASAQQIQRAREAAAVAAAQAVAKRKKKS